ncbi:MAG: hypothetical protein FWB97_04885 [Oscillospiraceae bacterium]|nr:hypothetical protein [Oscillospiraceae bacterium]
MTKKVLLLILLFAASSISSGCGGNSSDAAASNPGASLQGELSEPAYAPEVGELPPSAPYSPTEPPEETNLEDAIVIGERFFINQMFEIFLNHQLYLGRTIQYEGIFQAIEWDGVIFHIVFRYTAGCCGNDGRVGFELIMDGFEPFQDDTWVEVTGILEYDNGFLVLRPISIIEMDERGAEVVF